MSRSRRLASVIGATLCFSFMGIHAGSLSAQTVVDESAKFSISSSPIGPLGFVTGMVVSERTPYEKYIRTDVGGAYRWVPSSKQWVSITDQLDAKDAIGGVLSLAIDPVGTGTIYIAAGTTIYKSTNSGASWSKIGPTNLQINANEVYRNAGERLVLDPNNDQVIYYGSQSQGLYTSVNGGTTWAVVPSIPKGVATLGISFVVFDPSVKLGTRSKTIYVGVLGGGVYRSVDAGSTWHLLTQQPLATRYFPNRAVVNPQGKLFVTYGYESTGDGGDWGSAKDGAVYSFTNGVGTKQPQGAAHQLPSASAFGAIAIDPRNPDHLIVGTFLFANGCQLWNSTDGGKSWSQLATAYGTRPYAWWAPYWFTTGFSSVVIDGDTAYPDRVWATDGFGVWSSDVNTLASTATTWSSTSHGVEELVILDVHKTATQLLIGADDVNGFSKSSDTTYPAARWFGPNSFGNGSSVDFEESAPANVVRVGGQYYRGPAWGSYSSDGGNTWTNFPTVPGDRAAGSIAASSTNVNSLVWVPASGNSTGTTTAYYSANRGSTWTASKGAPVFNYINDFYGSQQPIASDRVNGNKFYLYAGYSSTNDGAFYRSVDGGKTFAKVSSLVLPADYQHALKAVPGKEGQLWINFVGAGTKSGLWRSVDGGTTWHQIAGFTQALAFGFGAPSATGNPAAIYVYGTLLGVPGLYYATDATGQAAGDLSHHTWRRISSASHAVPLPTLHAIEGDRKVFGKVYIGTGGRGVVYTTRVAP